MDQKSFINKALDAYLHCELWSGLEYHEDDRDNPTPWDDWAGVDDFSLNALSEARSDVEDFIISNWVLVRGLDPEQVGHDFSLTRNGHGTGFWDRGYGRLGDVLSDRCKPHGETNYFRSTDPHGNPVVDVD